MDFGQSVAEGFRKYVTFTGRARRSEFWWWVLFQLVVLAAAAVIDSSARGHGGLYGLAFLALFLPGVAVQVRRLHDTDHSGWWLLLCLVPIVGLIRIYWFCKDGVAGPGKYGADPKNRILPGLGGGYAEAATAAYAQTPAAPDMLSRLEQLGRLRDQGVLTQAEFEAEKAKLMGRTA